MNDMDPQLVALRKATKRLCGLAGVEVSLTQLRGRNAAQLNQIILVARNIQTMTSTLRIEISK